MPTSTACPQVPLITVGHHGVMTDGLQSWRLERDGNVLFSGVAGPLTWFGQVDAGVDPGTDASAPPPGAWPICRNPTWRIALAVQGDVGVVADPGAEVGPSQLIRAPGVVIPPGMLHRLRVDGDLVSLWIDPYAVGPMPAGATAVGPMPAGATAVGPITAGATGPGPVPVVTALSRATADRLLDAVDGGRSGVDGRLGPLVHRLLGPPPPLDPRLPAVFDHLAVAADLNELADRAGITPRRLRQLAAPVVAGQLRRLRSWHRLREAGLRYPFAPAAQVAADVGFADQAHLVRTSRLLTSQTLTEVYRGTLGTRPVTDVDGLRAEVEYVGA